MGGSKGRETRRKEKAFPSLKVRIGGWVSSQHDRKRGESGRRSERKGTEAKEISQKEERDSRPALSD